MKKLAKRNRWRDIIGIGGLVVGAIGLFLTVLGLWLIFYPPHIANSPSTDAKPSVLQQH
ncbi:MAG: hypothetical protein KGJ49_11720 [Alphaproteobacteria bacterium]|nr:hypothetical protein [Alphaproteobacteria bacterium]